MDSIGLDKELGVKSSPVTTFVQGLRTRTASIQTVNYINIQRQHFPDDRARYSSIFLVKARDGFYDKENSEGINDDSN